MIQYIKYLIALTFRCISIVGLEAEYAEDILNKRKIKWRIVSKEGKPQIGTADYNPSRYNLHITKGKVTKVTHG